MKARRASPVRDRRSNPLWSPMRFLFRVGAGHRVRAVDRTAGAIASRHIGQGLQVLFTDVGFGKLGASGHLT